MWKRFFKWMARFLLTLSLLGLLALFLPRLVTSLYAAPRIFSVDKVPAERVAIVFGAGLRYDGAPTAILRDRVDCTSKAK